MKPSVKFEIISVVPERISATYFLITVLTIFGIVILLRGIFLLLIPVCILVCFLLLSIRFDRIIYRQRKKLNDVIRLHRLTYRNVLQLSRVDIPLTVIVVEYGYIYDYYLKVDNRGDEMLVMLSLTKAGS